VAGPSVLVWRETLLPASETFIRNHITSLRRWVPELAGLYAARPSLPMVTTIVGGGELSRRDRVAVLTGRFRPLHDRLRTAPPDLVHAHFGTDAALLLPYLRSVPIPLVVTFHGHDATRRGGSPVRRLLLSRYRALFDRADRLVAVSEFVAERLVALGAPPEKIVARYLGSPPRPRPHQDRPRSGVLFVGRLVEKKGLLDLLTAMTEVIRHAPDTRLTVVGDGPLRGKAERRAGEFGLDVRFLGTQGVDTVRAEMEAAAVLCGPSRTASDGDAEGLGLVFVEAGQACLPVVAYAHGGVPEVVRNEQTGLLAPEGDVAALAHALAELITQPERARRYGSAGYDIVTQRFDIRQRTAELEELYDRVLDGVRST
jgi:glycosyltransferase involved in cell wall biosynthesis